MTDSAPGSDWPDLFRDLRSMLDCKDQLVTVFERSLSHVGEGRRIRLLCTALVGEDDLLQVKAGDRFSSRVDATGPGCALPSENNPGQRPAFWIWTSNTAFPSLEPLILSWEAGGRIAAIPDPGFLMNYGLVPRHVDRDKVLWDCPSTPQSEIVKAVASARCDSSTESNIKVEIKRSFLQDYSTLRKMALVQCFLEEWLLPGADPLLSRLGGARYLEEELHDLCYLRWSSSRQRVDSHLFVELTGHRVLCRPGPAPVSKEDYGELRWPGIAVPIRGSGLAYGGGIMDVVYVKDEVLGEFEGRTDYVVDPESGCVSLGSQWAVAYCDRYGRDLLRLELRKLYEGCPPWVVRHYHNHAVEEPMGDPQTMLRTSNVGTRARRIVAAVCKLSEALARLSSHVLLKPIAAEKFMAASPQDVKSQGWWTIPVFEPLGRHCPINLVRDAFLSRCKDLRIAVIEKWPEGVLRRVLEGFRIAHADIRSLGSLKLLEMVVVLCSAAAERHLQIPQDADDLSRVGGQSPTRVAALAPLFLLNDLRVASAHRTDSVEPALNGLGIHPSAVASGYGAAFDTLYDRVGEAVEFSARVVDEALAVAPDC